MGLEDELKLQEEARARAAAANEAARRRVEEEALEFVESFLRLCAERRIAPHKVVVYRTREGRPPRHLRAAFPAGARTWTETVDVMELWGPLVYATHESIPDDYLGFDARGTAWPMYGHGDEHRLSVEQRKPIDPKYFGSELRSSGLSFLSTYGKSH